MQAEPVALADLARQVVTRYGASARIKGLALELDCASDLPAGVQAQRRLLTKVLDNLVANALKFTERGRVVLRLRRGAPEGGADEGAEWLIFEVEDSGIGIHERDLPRLFQPFPAAR